MVPCGSDSAAPHVCRTVCLPSVGHDAFERAVVKRVPHLPHSPQAGPASSPSGVWRAAMIKEPAGLLDTADAGLRSESHVFPVSSWPAASRLSLLRVPHASRSRCTRPCGGRRHACAPFHHDVPIGLGECRRFPALPSFRGVGWAPCGSTRVAMRASASPNRARAREYRWASTRPRARQ